MRISRMEQLSRAERRAALARPALESRADIAAVALEVIDTVAATAMRLLCATPSASTA